MNNILKITYSGSFAQETWIRSLALVRLLSSPSTVLNFSFLICKMELIVGSAYSAWVKRLF